MIQVNLDKAKEITHEKRRDKRADLFKQLDIEATIPVLAEEAEAKRQEIRDKYAQIQTNIDNATNEQELKEAIKDLL